MTASSLLPILMMGFSVIFAFSLILTEGLTTWQFKRHLRETMETSDNVREGVRLAFKRSLLQSWGMIGLVCLGMFIVSSVVPAELEARVLLYVCSGLVTFLVAATIQSGSIDRMKRKGVVNAFKKAMEERETKVVEDLAAGVIDFGKLRFTILAVQALERWGSPRSVDLLRQIHMQAKEGFVLRPPGLKELARLALEKVEKGDAIGRAGTEDKVEILEQHFLFYRRLGKAAAQQSSTELNWFLGSLDRQLFPYQQQQHVLFDGYPQLFCTKCLTRSQMLKGKYHSMVNCRICAEAKHMIPGVETVLGTVGEEMEWNLGHGRLQLELWDKSKKKARYAEIDLLRINPAYGEFDWAIAGVLETLRNQHPPKKFPLKLDQELPEGLAPNTLHQLREFTRN